MKRQEVDLHLMIFLLEGRYDTEIETLDLTVNMIMIIRVCIAGFGYVRRVAGMIVASTEPNNTPLVPSPPSHGALPCNPHLKAHSSALNSD